jgi:NAD(P)-dependent dehydrogenase (short-subunit alcohol dehydrogenase family)
MSRLAGKTALAGEGAQVILSGRDSDRGEQVVAAIRSSGGSARFVRADLAELEDVKRLAAESGQADILVNNAGVFPFGPTSETDEEAFDQAFDVNVKAPFFLTAQCRRKRRTHRDRHSGSPGPVPRLSATRKPITATPTTMAATSSMMLPAPTLASDKPLAVGWSTAAPVEGALSE